MSRILFFTILFIILVALDFYVFQGYKLMVRRWIPEYLKIASILYWAVPIVLFLALLSVQLFVPSYHAKTDFLRWVVSGLFIVYVVKLVWLIFIIFDDIVRLIRFLFSASDMPNEAMMDKINRNEFIVSAGMLVAGSLFGGLVYGIIRGAHQYTVMNRSLKIKGLPEELEGLRILQISDVHSGSFWSKDAVKIGIDKIVEQNADLIFFTGDLVNNKSDEFDPFLEEFSRIKAPLGVYSILGNHDYGDYLSWPDESGMSRDENLERLKQHHKDAGWKLLLNEHVKIRHKDKEIAIIGVENWSAHPRFPKYGRLKQAYNGAEEAALKLLLSHDPSHWKAEVTKDFKDIHATFSGHTHGMQFGVDTKYYRWSPIKYQYPEWADLYEDNDQLLYVNRGFGYIGYPGRLGFYPEITVFELTSA